MKVGGRPGFSNAPICERTMADMTEATANAAALRHAAYFRMTESTACRLTGEHDE